MSMQSVCRLFAEGCAVAACWAPLLSVSAVLLYLGARDAAEQRFQACPVPLHWWAVAAGAAMLLVALLQLVQYAATTCSIVLTSRGDAAPIDGAGTDDPQAKARTGGCAAVPFSDHGCCDGYRIAAPFTSGAHRASQSTGMLVLISLTGVIVTFIVVWFLVGAVWVFPLKDVSNVCDHTLVSVCFYLIMVVLVALAVLLFLACVGGCCAIILAASVGAAFRGLFDSVMSQMGFTPPAHRAAGAEEEEEALAKGSAAGAAVAHRVGGASRAGGGGGGAGGRDEEDEEEAGLLPGFALSASGSGLPVNEDDPASVANARFPEPLQPRAAAAAGVSRDGRSFFGRPPAAAAASAAALPAPPRTSSSRAEDGTGDGSLQAAFEYVNSNLDAGARATLSAVPAALHGVARALESAAAPVSPGGDVPATAQPSSAAAGSSAASAGSLAASAGVPGTAAPIPEARGPGAGTDRRLQEVAPPARPASSGGSPDGAFFIGDPSSGRAPR